MLIVSTRDRKILLRDLDGSLTQHADLSGLATGHLNDMLVDHDGRAWVGNFGFDLMGGAPANKTVLICVDCDGTAKIVAHELGFPNGMVLTPDGQTWAAFGDPPSSTDVGEIIATVDVAPDGICFDAEGAAWVADAAHGRLIRVAQGGQILEERELGTGVFACMLGGDDGCTLFASVAPTFHEAAASMHHQASILMTGLPFPTPDYLRRVKRRSQTLSSPALSAITLPDASRTK
jgi:sugar lactone lactonase YvrE